MNDKTTAGQQADVLTDAQITAGSNVLCDCRKPKRIGRNAAIDVFHAMNIQPVALSDQAVAGQQAGDAAGDVETWQDRINDEGLFDVKGRLYGGWTAVTMARDAEIADLRAQLASANDSVAQYQQNRMELAEELREARREARAQLGSARLDAECNKLIADKARKVTKGYYGEGLQSSDIWGLWEFVKNTDAARALNNTTTGE